ncbi:hypothetical protein JCM19233_4849 [Vibrio astriarenae]|nr:hypothetical protein JCM19233_4849 [Vibrio sp. C7]
MLTNPLQPILDAIDLLPLSINKNGTYTHIHLDVDLMPLASLVFSRLSNIGTSCMNIRLIANGKDLHPSLFIQSRIGDGLIEHSLLDNDLVAQCLNEGGTFVFDHINDHVTELRGIQEHIEGHHGVKCWIQCYLTKSSQSAFNMHADDHSFITLQLFGSKHWMHDENDFVDYHAGDIAFYPKGKHHDVHGKGTTSMHLTIAFEGFDDQTYDELNLEQQLAVLKPRVGNAFPFSIDPNHSLSGYGFRGYYNFLPHFDAKKI